MEEESQYEKGVKREGKIVFSELLKCIPLFLISIAVVAAAYNSILIPCEEKPAIWFQRSGSVVVVFAVWIEYKLFNINGYINPTGLIASFDEINNQKYGTIHKIASGLAAILAVSGTVIWGYGDLLI
ncbi:MAG: hypothetical protein ACJAW7_002426 [Candidatus Azotimanducaceae bacterium]|jgi:hypothetical protein